MGLGCWTTAGMGRVQALVDNTGIAVLSIIDCHTGSVLMNAVATQDCTHDPTF